jgi:hypothetical protein
MNKKEISKLNSLGFREKEILKSIDCKIRINKDFKTEKVYTVKSENLKKSFLITENFKIIG